jgi:hypothetical protein
MRSPTSSTTSPKASTQERSAERLIIGHGDIIELGWQDELANAWRLEGVEV